MNCLVTQKSLFEKDTRKPILLNGNKILRSSDNESLFSMTIMDLGAFLKQVQEEENKDI